MIRRPAPRRRKRGNAATPRPRDFSLPVNLRPQYACGGSFTATEPLKVYEAGPVKNPAPHGKILFKSDALTARITVGFAIDADAFWTLDDLVKFYTRLRKAQGHGLDASFLAQRGIYTHQDGRHVVDEPGAQIVIIYTKGDLTPQAFAEEMYALADGIRHRMHQESVLLECQQGGQAYAWSFVDFIGEGKETRPSSPEYRYRKAHPAYDVRPKRAQRAKAKASAKRKTTRR